MTRVGFIGPVAGDRDLFARRLEHLVSREGCDLVHYLGDCDALDEIAASLRGVLGLDDSEGIDGMARALAERGHADEIERFLDAREALSLLALCRAVPKPPARTIEMLEDRIALLVHDKAILDEEDIANADVVIYGRATAPLLKKIGPRVFFTPGPAGSGYGLASVEEGESLRLVCYDADARVIAEELLAPRSARFSVTT